MESAPEDGTKSANKRHDAHDYALLGILFLTLVATAIAAISTGSQAWIARDQEHRALRAYLVAETALVFYESSKTPAIRIDVENMGQTPVYDLYYDVGSNLIGKYERYPDFSFESAINRNCEAFYALNASHPVGRTFVKKDSEIIGFYNLNSKFDALDEIFSDSKRAIAYGTICYRDIFRAIHAVRFCYEWTSADYRPYQCQHEIPTEDP